MCRGLVTGRLLPIRERYTLRLFVFIIYFIILFVRTDDHFIRFDNPFIRFDNGKTLNQVIN